MMKRDELRKRLQKICHNTKDYTTSKRWNAMTVDQLRAVVALLDNGGVDVINEKAQPNGKGHCFTIQRLVEYLVSEVVIRHPVHRDRFVTERQRELVLEAYRRITGDSPPSVPDEAKHRFMEQLLQRQLTKEQAVVEFRRYQDTMRTCKEDFELGLTPLPHAERLLGRLAEMRRDMRRWGRF